MAGGMIFFVKKEKEKRGRKERKKRKKENERKKIRTRRGSESNPEAKKGNLKPV